MQYIHSLKITYNTLQQAIYTPTQLNQICKGSLVHLKPCCLPLPVANHQLSKLPMSKLSMLKLPSRLPWRNKSKFVMQLLGVMVLVLPTKSLTNVQPLTGMEKISITKTLTIATTNEHTFKQDEHIHGFAYDAARRYADHLGATLSIKSYPTTDAAMQALQVGDADIVLGSTNTQYNDTVTTAVSCSGDRLTRLGLDSKTGFVFQKSNTALMSDAKDYLCTPQVQNETHTMAKFYQTNALDAYSVSHFERTINERLPKYKKEFQRQADKYDHDWQLLVAISYQESHLLPTAVSRTGVEGLMMLTRDTAAAMGVSDRTDAYQSIQGGAKYLNELDQLFLHVPQSERLWFVLAAYNMGPNAVKNIQSKIAQSGKNPNLWSNVYTYLSDNAHQNGRYVQCMHYVTNIRTYLEALKSNELYA